MSEGQQLRAAAPAHSAEGAGAELRSLQLLGRSWLVGLTLLLLLGSAVHVAIDRAIQYQAAGAQPAGAGLRAALLAQQVALALADASLRPQAERAALVEPLLTELDGALGALAARPAEATPAGEATARLLQQALPYASRCRALVQLWRSTPEGEPARAEARTILELARGPLADQLTALEAAQGSGGQAQLERLRLAQKLVLLAVLLTLTIEALFIFRPVADRVRDYASSLQGLGQTDALTGAASGRRLEELLARELLVQHRYGRPCTLLLCGLDGLEAIGAAHGRGAIDALLTRFAALARQQIRRTDEVGRTGDDEFVLLLPETGLPGAAQLAERLRRAIESSEVEVGPLRLRLTASVVVTALEAGDVSPADVLERARRRKAEAHGAGAGRGQATPKPAASPA